MISIIWRSSTNKGKLNIFRVNDVEESTAQFIKKAFGDPEEILNSPFKLLPSMTAIPKTPPKTTVSKTPERRTLNSNVLTPNRQNENVLSGSPNKVFKSPARFVLTPTNYKLNKIGGKENTLRKRIETENESSNLDEGSASQICKFFF